MSLSPEEQDVFDWVASALRRDGHRFIPWNVVGVGVAVVVVGVGGAVLMGLSLTLVAVFCGTFVIALGVGLMLIARSDRRHRDLWAERSSNTP